MSDKNRLSAMPTGLEAPDEAPNHAVKVSIYQPSRSTMQAGRAKSKHWILEFEPLSAPFIDPLMGWEGSCDPNTQVRLNFPSKAHAIAFARRRGWHISVHEIHMSQPQPKNYADNFFGQTSFDQS